MSERGTERRMMGEEASWPRTELRAILANLREVRERLSELVGELQDGETAADEAEERQTVRQVQRRIGVLTSDLVGALGRLETLALDLRRPAATGDPDESASEAEEILRGEIQCVIADRLAPAIEALLDLQRPQVPGETSE
jgi:hypothetical protein